MKGEIVIIYLKNYNSNAVRGWLYDTYHQQAFKLRGCSIEYDPVFTSVLLRSLSGCSKDLSIGEVVNHMNMVIGTFINTIFFDRFTGISTP